MLGAVDAVSRGRGRPRAHLQGLSSPASWRRRAWRSLVPITPMPSIRRTGGSNVLWALIMTVIRWSKAYHKLLVWDMMSAPKLTRVGEQLLNPVIGKSVALYLVNPARPKRPDGDPRDRGSPHRSTGPGDGRGNRCHAGGFGCAAVVPRRSDRSVGSHRIGDGIVGDGFSCRSRSGLRLVAQASAGRRILAHPHRRGPGRGPNIDSNFCAYIAVGGVASLPDHR